MYVFQNSLLAISGLIFGSFLTCVAYRLPRDINFWKGRSRCPRCHQIIPFFCNIPLISYIFLRARCFHCHRKISLRYPLIEGATALLFVFAGAFFPAVQNNVPWLSGLGFLALPFFLFLVLLLELVFLIDWEWQIIPDSLVYLGLLVVFGMILFSGQEFLFQNLWAGFLAALFLLSVYLLTRGRGMGLGDVKLALLLGLVLGPKGVVVAFFLAFLTGAMVGIILVLGGVGSLKQKIAFGPFLVTGFVLASFLGKELIRLLFLI